MSKVQTFVLGDCCLSLLETFTLLIYPIGNEISLRATENQLCFGVPTCSSILELVTFTLLCQFTGEKFIPI